MDIHTPEQGASELMERNARGANAAYEELILYTKSPSPVTGQARLEYLLEQLSIAEIGRSECGQVIWEVKAPNVGLDEHQWEGDKPGLLEVLEVRSNNFAFTILEETNKPTSPEQLELLAALNAQHKALLEDLVMVYRSRL